MNTVENIIEKCGGRQKISAAAELHNKMVKPFSGDKPKTLSVDAVRKWLINGIPEIWWDLIIELYPTRIAPTTIYKANKLVREGQTNGGVNTKTS